MNKYLLVLILIALVFTPSISMAAELTRIGALDVSGKSYPEWWYTGTNPTLSGTAAANSEVTITVDSTPTTVTADASGNWTFNSDLLTSGDHTVSIVADGETMAFTLHLGQPLPANVAETVTSTTTGTTVGAGETATVPETGTSTVIAYVMLAAGLIVGGITLNKVRA